MAFRKDVQHLSVRAGIEPPQVLILSKGFGKGRCALVAAGQVPPDAVPGVVLDRAPGGRADFLAEEPQVVELLYLPALLLLKPSPQVDVRAVPYRHLVAVAAVQQQLAFDQLLDDFLSRIGPGVTLEREPQQAEAGAGAFAAHTETEQTGCLQSPGSVFAGNLRQRALRLEPLAVGAADRSVRPHHRGEVVVQGGRSDLPVQIDRVEEAEQSALVLRDSRSQAGQQVQRHRFEGIRPVKHLLDLGDGSFAEQSMGLAFTGSVARMDPRQLRVPSARSYNLRDEPVDLLALVDVLQGAETAFDLGPLRADRLRHVSGVLQQALVEEQAHRRRHPPGAADELRQYLDLRQSGSPPFVEQGF